MRDKQYVSISKVGESLDMQTQYVAYYVDGVGGKPKLSEGLDFKKPDDGNYHTYKIFSGDVDEFIARIKRDRK